MTTDRLEITAVGLGAAWAALLMSLFDYGPFAAVIGALVLYGVMRVGEFLANEAIPAVVSLAIASWRGR